jgi:hypothetical protein
MAWVLDVRGFPTSGTGWAGSPERQP